MRLGRRGEAIAARELEAEGWTVLARNWRDGPRELDLVVRRGDVLAFVEVKTRRLPTWNEPLDALGPRKRREVERAARAWLRSDAGGRRAGSGPRPSRIRFDVVVVRLRERGRPIVEHLPDAWRPGWSGS